MDDLPAPQTALARLVREDGLAEHVAMILIFGSVSYKIFSQLFQSAAYWISSKKQYTVSLAEILERKVSMTVFTEHSFKSG